MRVTIVNCDNYDAVYVDGKFYDYGEFYGFHDILEMGVRLAEQYGDPKPATFRSFEVDWEWLDDIQDNWPENEGDVKVV